VHPFQVMFLVGEHRRRLDIPDDVDEGVNELLRGCWEEAPSARPNFGQILEQLNGMNELRRSSTWLQIAQGSDDTF
jgi:hypothetical protein